MVATDGHPVIADVLLNGAAGQVLRHGRTDSAGRFAQAHLLYGSYSIEASAPGFAVSRQQFSVESPVPEHLLLRLKIAPVIASVDVAARQQIVDPDAARPAVEIGRGQLAQHLPPQPGRGLLDAIADQPGWVFEGDGVLHPRGSEYETQFVLNGVPRTDNLSPSFAAPLPDNDVESGEVLVAGIPAEFGRSLGGIVDISTGAAAQHGWHGGLAVYGGSFATAGGDARVTFGTRTQQLLVSGSAYGSDRFLDPPVLPNYTNHATAQNIRADDQMQLSARDSLELDFAHANLGSDVPNELVQQEAGQLQTRRSHQDSGSATWEHIVSPDLLLTVAGSVLDVSAELHSNALSTPVIVQQTRGFGQGWVHADAAWHHGHHDLKAGADAILRHVHEDLQYTITDASYFDPGTTQQAHFAQTLWDSEPAAFVEDTMHYGRWNVAAGVRFDDYSFVVDREAWSPRVAVSRYLPSAHLLLHAAYDRIFQVPAIEGLLLASSPQLNSVSSFVERLPVEPARANYYELGFDEAFNGALRLTGNIFSRRFTNYADDDTLLNTGVSFPIAIASASIRGEELSLVMPDWRHFAARASYSNQIGVATGPITGGLFLGDEGASELATTGKFPISQDQRNTVAAYARWSPIASAWVATRYAYNSGLPVELDDDDTPESLEPEYGSAIINQVDFVRGRVRPWWSADVSAGCVLLHRNDRDLHLEVHVANLANKVNVINFASLFSGTALAPPRSIDARLRWSF
ncbi:MAG TPA: TonB-dependent receptor [Acidobacteriaceae bacterium]